MQSVKANSGLPSSRTHHEIRRWFLAGAAAPHTNLPSILGIFCREYARPPHHPCPTPPTTTGLHLLHLLRLFIMDHRSGVRGLRYSMRSVDWHQDITPRVKECRDITPGLQKRDTRHAHDVRRGPPVDAPSNIILWYRSTRRHVDTKLVSLSGSGGGTVPSHELKRHAWLSSARRLATVAGGLAPRAERRERRGRVTALEWYRYHRRGGKSNKGLRLYCKKL